MTIKQSFWNKQARVSFLKSIFFIFRYNNMCLYGVTLKYTYMIVLFYLGQELILFLEWRLNEHTMYVFAFTVCHLVTTLWWGHCNTIALSYFEWLFDFCYQWIYVQKCYQNLVIALAAVFCDRSPRMHPSVIRKGYLNLTSKSPVLYGCRKSFFL